MKINSKSNAFYEKNITFATKYKKMRQLLILLSMLTAMAAQGRKWTATDVENMIRKVNTSWQQRNKAEVRAFWDNAAYHTGNIEVYKVLKDDGMLDYSRRWAEHNRWQGATERDKAKWKYKKYGEGQDFVLFGDWQICFQTYLDLNELSPDRRKVAHAREVMGYIADSRATDYWWWADALYMVMPVMTKMYRLTGDEKYLDKLYANLTYSDSIMLDAETGLYFRDGKYVYPKHKSQNGLKDFWARGDGWVLAGLAKVLQDMPQSYRHRAFFVSKFQRLAAAVAQCQQPQGYWTRSMLDANHAPGPETSGTAFFCYGLQWGINNGLLDEQTYRPTVEKAWKYLTETALQRDGRVGYVQPIGERAIPGQTVDAKSEANFGTGAFLLAACEQLRTLRMSNPQNDRRYWCQQAWRMAQPVLENMAKGELQKKMKTEFSPSFDKRNRKVIYMETFGRLMAGIAPWLSLPDDNTEEGRQRSQLRQWALAAYRNAVDPASPDYLLWRSEGQTLVDAAYLAESFIRGYDALWKPLDEQTKRRYIEEFTLLRRIDPPYTNWLLFASTIESFLAKVGAPHDNFRISMAVRKTEEWYVGDGWYSDGQGTFAFDYYTSFVFHAMYLETLQNMIDAKQNGWGIDTRKFRNRALKRAQKHSIILERFISPEGTFPVIGRSTPYRLAAMQPLALMAWYEKLPAELSNGQVRAALTAVMHRMFDQQNNYNEEGYLTIGFCGSQPGTADWYTNNGSLYMTSLAFMPLGLPAAHPFWTDGSEPWTQVKAWNGKPFPKDHIWKEE